MYHAPGSSSGATAIYSEIRKGTFRQKERRLEPVYLGLIDQVLPLGRHSIKNHRKGLEKTIIDDFYGAAQKAPLAGANLSFDVSKGGVVPSPYPDPKTGKKSKVRYAGQPQVDHFSITGGTKEWQKVPPFMHAVLDSIPFRAQQAYLRRVEEESKDTGQKPWSTEADDDNSW